MSARESFGKQLPPQPGPGWGGSCFPKDSRALIKIAEDADYSFDLLKGVIAVNDQQFERVVQKVVQAAGSDPAEKTIAVWGLTFKAGTDDLRDSPSIEIIKRLLALGFKVQAFDPTVETSKPGIPENLNLSLSPIEVTVGADVLLILTEWDDFKWISPTTIATTMNGKQIVDARNLLDRKEWERAGFTYQGIGR